MQLLSCNSAYYTRVAWQLLRCTYFECGLTTLLTSWSLRTSSPRVTNWLKTSPACMHAHTRANTSEFGHWLTTCVANDAAEPLELGTVWQVQLLLVTASRCWYGTRQAPAAQLVYGIMSLLVNVFLQLWTTTGNV